MGVAAHTVLHSSSPRSLPRDFTASGDGSGGGDDGDGGVATASVDVKQQAPWRAVLRRLRPSPSRTRSPRLGSGGSASDGGRLHPLARLAPDLALSTPNLAKSPKVVASGPRSTLTLGFPSRVHGASSSCLPRDLVAEQETVTKEIRGSIARSHASNSDRKEHWSRTRSMESMDGDKEPSTSTPFPDEVFEDANSTNLAQSLGLDMRLYSVDRCESYSSSTPGTTVSSSISDSPVIKAKGFDDDKRMFIPDNASFLSSSGFLASQESFVDRAYGTITFAASYYQKNKKLCIELEKLDDLPPKGKNSVYDIIVRLSILPAEKQIKLTQILRGSLSPMIREDFNFGIKDPIGKIMRFSVYNSMYQGKHDAIGHACFNVEDVISGKPRKYSMKLTRQSQPGSSCGLLQVYLQLSQEQRLIIDTIQARNLCISSVLRSNRSSETFSTYIKITFYNAGQKVKSKKSSVVTSDRNPQYEFSSDFKVVSDQLDNCYIVLSVVLKASLRKDVTLGRYILGPHYFSERREITPWGRVILQHEQICHWFHLYL